MFTIAAIAVTAYAPLALSQAINCSTQIYGVTLSGTPAAINISNAVATTLGTTPVNLTELEYDTATGQMSATDGAPA